MRDKVNVFAGCVKNYFEKGFFGNEFFCNLHPFLDTCVGRVKSPKMERCSSG